MRRECRERFPHHWLQKKPLVRRSRHASRHVRLMHVSWCMSGSLTRGGGKNVPGIPGACVTRYFTYLAKGPFRQTFFRDAVHISHEICTRIVMFCCVLIIFSFPVCRYATDCLVGRFSVIHIFTVTSLLRICMLTPLVHTKICRNDMLIVQVLALTSAHNVYIYVEGNIHFRCWKNCALWK